MTEPTPVGGVLPEVLAEVVDRAGHGYERWAELVAQTGYCHHPDPPRRPHRPGRPDHRRGPHRVRLGAGAGRGAVEGLRHPPGAALPVLCATYRADAYQLLAAGLKGGKGVPESVAGHPGC
jgi:hypothetical protein